MKDVCYEVRRAEECATSGPGRVVRQQNAAKASNKHNRPDSVSVFITAVPITKVFACVGGEGGGHVLRETTSRGLCGLVCPSRTSERGGEGDCVKEGGGGEGKRERERALGLLLCHIPGHRS